MATKDPSPQDPFLKAVFMHMEEAKIDWQKVAKQCGISYGKNAKRRFNDSILKPLNLKYMGSQIISLDDDASTTDVQPVKATPNRKTPPKQKVGPTKTPRSAIKRRAFPKKEVKSDNDSDEVPQEMEVDGDEAMEA